MPDPNDPFAPVPSETVVINDVTKQEIDPRARAKLEALGTKDAGWFSNLWASFGASVKRNLMYVVTQFASATDEVFAFCGQFFKAAQGEKNPAFYDLAAVILGDLTGVEVDAEALKASAFGSGRLAAMQTFGADLYSLLEDEFKPTSGNLEEGDVAPAEKFLGFLMNFSIRQGNIEALVSMLPEEIRVGEGFRAYGELMAKNLGLGRMARRALQPLIQILVADPLMYNLQETYRPKRIGASPAIKKFFRDTTFETQMRKELGQEGYTDDRINDLIADLRPLLAARELIDHTFRFGDSTVSIGGGTSLDLKGQLAQHGYSDIDAQRLIDVSRPVLKESEIALLFLNGIIEHDVASGYMGKLGYDDQTAELALQAHSLQHQHQHRLGLGELKKAFKNNVIDLLELKAHLTSLGFSADDIQIITLDLLTPVTGKVRQLSLAEIKAGYKASVLTKQQAHDHLKALGYSDADVAVIIDTLPGPKPPATPGTPTGTGGTAA
jgi:hypothetical protein